jgi:hypothetical protein
MRVTTVYTRLSHLSPQNSTQSGWGPGGDEQTRLIVRRGLSQCPFPRSNGAKILQESGGHDG